MTTVPDLRIRLMNQVGRNPQGDFILYWMTSFRRLRWNFSLQHAADLARELGKPLVILETLWADYPYASHRLHRFLVDGMDERNRVLRGTPVIHYPYVEPAPGEGNGLVAALGERACCVVSDDFPSFFMPEVHRSEGEKMGVSLELVDSNGLLPLLATDRVFSAAYHFRRFLQKTLPELLPETPDPDPLETPTPGAGAVATLLPSSALQRWPPTPGALLSNPKKLLESLPLDESVGPAPLSGTSGAARTALSRFLTQRLIRYAEDRNHPDLDVTSGLSPYLHFGAISTHEIFSEVSAFEGWTPLRLSDRTDGAREGWWGMGPGAEAFLDQLVTWREIGFNMSSKRDDYLEYESLPDWAKETLAVHEGDPRPQSYSLEEFREARTHDPLWNAAQRQLATEGTIHNYLRMLWGKKILEWSPTAQDALATMIDLNDRLALDGRDPNSYSGIFWCLGRYDRGWPERPIFGKVRSMTSKSTRRKVKLDNYLNRFSSNSG